MNPSWHQQQEQARRQQEQARRQQEQIRLQQEQVHQQQELMRQQQERMRHQQEEHMQHGAHQWMIQKEEAEKKRLLNTANASLQQKHSPKANFTVGNMQTERGQFPSTTPIVKPEKNSSCLASAITGFFKFILILAVIAVVLFVIATVLGVNF